MFASEFSIYLSHLSFAHFQFGYKNSVSSLGSTRNPVIAFCFVCSLCRKLGKSILHGAQNPVICVAVFFIPTEPIDMRGKIYEDVQFKPIPSDCEIWGLSFKFSGLLSFEFLICKMRTLYYFSRFFHGDRFQGPPKHKDYVFTFVESPGTQSLM